MVRELLLAGALLSGISANAGQNVKVLFLGNSYTAYNNLPQMTASVALSAGDTLVFQSNVPGGTTLRQHSTNATSLGLIAQGNWDYVVLQEQSQYPAFPDAQVAAEVYPFARKLDSLITAANGCTETVFYRTWGRKNGDQQNCPFFPPVCTYAGMDSMLALRYRIMADSNRAVLSPVGQVWKRLRQLNPNIELYNPDESHPSMAGSYAAACTFYATFFRKNPLLITDNQSLPASDALAIRQAVKTVVYESLLFWNVGKYDPKAQFAFTGGAGRQVSFQNASQNAATYQWQFGSGQSSDTAKNPTYTFTANGTYTVRLIASRCGRSDTTTQQVTVSATGVSNTEKFPEIQLYPNPVGDVLKVAGLPQDAHIEVLDLSGKRLPVYAEWLAENWVVSTAALPGGLYTIRIGTQSGVEARIFRKM